MTKKVCSSVSAVLLFTACFAAIAAAQTSWWRTYGGTLTDQGWSVQQTSDGGYIIAGRTYSFGAGNSDVYLTKTNTPGDTLWTRTYGGTSEDDGYSVQQTTDSGYIITGYTASFSAGGVYLIRTNASGDTLWTRTYGYLGDGRGVQQTSDGGFIIAGAGYRDVYLIKTTASGDTLWTRTYGGTSEDVGTSVQQTLDGGYIVAGYTLTFGAGGYDAYLIKTDASGDTMWTRTYGGTGDDQGYSVQQTSDGGYIVAGSTSSFGAGSGDVYLIKINAAGNTEWTRTYGGTGWDGGYSVQQTSDGGYIIAGRTYSFGAGNSDVYLIKTDSLGNVGVAEPSDVRPTGAPLLPVQPNPFHSFARVPGHETELFALSDVTGRQVAICKGDRVGAGLRPGVYFLSLIRGDTSTERREGRVADVSPCKAVTATVIKAGS